MQNQAISELHTVDKKSRFSSKREDILKSTKNSMKISMPEKTYLNLL